MLQKAASSLIFVRTTEHFTDAWWKLYCSRLKNPVLLWQTGERKWVERNGSNRPPVPWVESSPFRNWVEWTGVDLEKCHVQGRQHIDFDPSPFDPIRPQSIRPKLFDRKGRPNSFRPISFDPFHAIPGKRLYAILFYITCFSLSDSGSSVALGVTSHLAQRHMA